MLVSPKGGQEEGMIMWQVLLNPPLLYLPTDRCDKIGNAGLEAALKQRIIGHKFGPINTPHNRLRKMRRQNRKLYALQVKTAADAGAHFVSAPHL
jgi:hypothetical protein